MNSKELEKIISKDSLLRRTFVGVFASDELDFVVQKRPACLIVNTDPSYMPGTHWIAIYIDARGNGHYFDSFGRDVFCDQFVKFLKMNVKRVYMNKSRLQSSDTFVCGIYCIYFLYHRVRGINQSEILKKFSMRNFIRNDKIVCEFLSLYSFKVF